MTAGTLRLQAPVSARRVGRCASVPSFDHATACGVNAAIGASGPIPSPRIQLIQPLRPEVAPERLRATALGPQRASSARSSRASSAGSIRAPG